MKKRYFLSTLALAAVGIFFGGVWSVKADVDDAAVTYLSETQGVVGEEIIIHGNDFGDDCPDRGTLECQLTVSFGAGSVNFHDGILDENAVSWTDTAITVKVPEDAEDGAITVYRNEIFNYGEDDAYDETFEITSDQEFTVQDEDEAATITKVWPTEVAVGDTVTIYGQNLVDACEGESTLTCTAQVYFGDGLVDFQVNVEGVGVSWDDNEIVVTVPEGAETGAIRVYHDQTYNYNESDAYTVGYNIEGSEMTVYDSSTDAARTQEILDIQNEAAALFPDESYITNFDTITTALGLDITQDTDAEDAAEALLEKAYGSTDYTDIVDQTATEYSYIFFVAYGFGTTSGLGAGERAGVLNSWRTAYDPSGVPDTDAEWQDVLKISNGRWPAELSNYDAEGKALENFQKIYKRNPDFENAYDEVAIKILAYGLRPEPRDTERELGGIEIFRNIYGYTPTSAVDWDAVRAITYSGATR